MADATGAALARRYYMHVQEGGTLTARDVGRMVEALEEVFQMYVDANEARIDAEAKLRKSALQELSALGQASEAYQAQLAAEAKLAKAADVIEWALISWDDHWEYGYNMQGDWVSDARTTLAELTGGSNE